MELHAALVALLNKELHRVKTLIVRLFPLFTCKVAAPWLKITFVESIPLWPYLEQQRVKAQFLKQIQLLAESVTHLLACETCKVVLPNCMHPHPTELTLRGIGISPCRVSNQPVLLSAQA